MVWGWGGGHIEHGVGLGWGVGHIEHVGLGWWHIEHVVGLGCGVGHIEHGVVLRGKLLVVDGM